MRKFSSLLLAGICFFIVTTSKGQSTFINPAAVTISGSPKSDIEYWSWYRAGVYMGGVIQGSKHRQIKLKNVARHFIFKKIEMPPQ